MTVGSTARSEFVTVFGGSGFIGRNTVTALCRAGYRVRVAVRKPFLAGDLRLAGETGHVQLVQANVRHRPSVEAALEGAASAINLVGILAPRRQQTFEATHLAGAVTIASAAKRAGIRSLVQVSAIGADPESSSVYAASKGRAEEEIRSIFPQAVILRPSIVFGPEDGFFNRFAQMACLSPALPLIGGGRTLFQPVHVGDVAACIVAALALPRGARRVYELGGPGVHSFRELMVFLLHQIARRRLLVPLPFAAATAMGSALDLAFRLWPFGLPPLTADQVTMLRQDNVVAPAGSGVGGLSDLVADRPVAIETGVPPYLWRYRPAGQFHPAPATPWPASAPDE